jgi:hypothetical protein
MKLMAVVSAPTPGTKEITPRTPVTAALMISLPIFEPALSSLITMIRFLI